jgi:hypothetical protein
MFDWQSSGAVEGRQAEEECCGRQRRTIGTAIVEARATCGVGFRWAALYPRTAIA